MQIVIIAHGTRGDVQPAIALGKALQTRGHAVRLAVSANFARWVGDHGLEAAGSTVNIQAMMESDGGQAWIEHGTNPMRQTGIMQRLLDDVGWDLASSAWAAGEDADVVVSSLTSYIFAASIAEKTGARHISMWLQPSLAPTRSGPATINAPLPQRWSLVNYLLGKYLIEPVTWRWYGGINNRLRTNLLGLAPQTRAQNQAALASTLRLHAYSTHVVPHPGDWPSNMHTTGYWFLDEPGPWAAPSALVNFLDAGPPPIAIGFGSMTGRDPLAFTRLILQAVAQAGQRAVLLSGWAGLGEIELPATVYRAESIPHRWLFPRVKTVVHHGGAGTTAESLRAGVPSVIVPHLGDQVFWGKRVAALGAGPPPILRPRLTASRLAAAITRATSDANIQAQARALAKQICAEDGLGGAVELVLPFLDDRGE